MKILDPTYRPQDNELVIFTQHTQTLSDFREKAGETLDRIEQTGEAEILTVNGEARAVLLSPAAYDSLTQVAQVSRDIDVIRRSMKEIDKKNGLEAGAFFDGLRATLLEMKARQHKSAAE